MTPLVPARIYSNIHYKNYLLLLIICLLAFWPITFNIFSSKGDSLHYFLPYRYNISEAIRHGEFPFWSPYIYLGHPVYGDMQSGAWNPFVWFFSLFGTYDLTLFHLEFLVYIFLGGVGMYKLVNFLYKDASSALLLATAYMLSGVMLGGQVINWAASAAFLPFVIHFYLVMVKTRQWSAAWKTGLSLFLLLVCGYPSYFILISYLLLLLVSMSLFDRFKKKQYTLSITWSKYIFQHLLIIITFIGLSLPAIISYADLLPYYSRGSGVVYSESIANTFELQHLLSFLFPPTIGAPYSYSETDMTCRNIYIGFLALLVLIAYPPRFTRQTVLLTLLVLFSLLFSLGDATPLQKWCYDYIPLMDTFRHPAQTRLFVVFGLLLLTAPGLKFFFEGIREKKYYTNKKLKIVSISLLAFFSLAVIFSLKKLYIFDAGIFSAAGFNKTVKNIVDNFRFNDAVFLSASIQLACISIFLTWFFRKTLTVKKFYWLWAVNIIVMAQLILPITFVSQTNPKTINEFIRASKDNYPAGFLNRPIKANSTDIDSIYDRSFLEFGLPNFYKRTISITHITYSPTFFSSQDPVFANEKLYDFIASKPVVYIADSVIRTKDTSALTNDTTSNIIITDDLPGLKNSANSRHLASIQKISFNRFEITASNSNEAYLVLTQSYHHHWQAWVDGKREKVNKVNMAFMGIHLSPGDHHIVFKFVPTNTINALWVMLATIAGLIIASIISLSRRNKSQQAL